MKHEIVLLSIWIVGYLLVREFVPPDWWIGAGAMALVLAGLIADEVAPSRRWFR